MDNNIEKPAADCPHCAARLEEEKQGEEVSFAMLLALVPLMVVTLFGQMGAL